MYKELRNLNINESTGLDDNLASFLKDGYIKTPIMSIINKSIATGIVPEDFKRARVKPLSKKGYSLEVGNYQPVSIHALCIVSKILGKCVYVQLLDFLNNNYLLYSYQSGFRNKFSTDTCLIYV